MHKYTLYISIKLMIMIILFNEFERKSISQSGSIMKTKRMQLEETQRNTATPVAFCTTARVCSRVESHFEKSYRAEITRVENVQYLQVILVAGSNGSKQFEKLIAADPNFLMFPDSLFEVGKELPSKSFASQAQSTFRCPRGAMHRLSHPMHR